MNTIKLYLHSMRMLLKSQLQYPASFIMQTIAQLVMEGGEFMAVILIVDRFDKLNQWMPGDLFFFFGIMSVTFYLTECFGRGVTGAFPGMVRAGQMDTLLIRPRGVLTQVLCTAALIIGCRRSAVQWSLLKVLLMGESMLCGFFLILGLFLIEAVFCIYSVKSVELVNALTYGGRSACEYPIDIFPRPLRFVFTVIAPFALVMHVPAAYILDKPLFGWPAWVALVTPLAGLVTFAVMYLIFRRAMRHYRSTGS